MKDMVACTTCDLLAQSVSSTCIAIVLRVDNTGECLHAVLEFHHEALFYFWTLPTN